MKKKRAIVFTVSQNLTFSIACVMMDLKRLSPDLADEIVIIHDGISEKDQNLLSMILPTRFIEYIFPVSLSIIRKDTLYYFTKMVFAKFECLKLLDDYQNVLLLDYDIVVRKDISELFDYCESGFKTMLTGKSVGFQFHKPLAQYDMERNGISAATFLLQDHLKDYTKLYFFCYENLKKYSKVIYLPEQAILNIMIQEFSIEPCFIDAGIYAPHPNDDEAADAKIIHAYGQPKFWNGLENEQWNRNYQEWLSMGGTPYVKKTILSKVYNRIKVSIQTYGKKNN